MREPVGISLHRTPLNNIAFGHSMHTCLGIKLAKMEAQAMLEIVLEPSTNQNTCLMIWSV